MTTSKFTFYRRQNSRESRYSERLVLIQKANGLPIEPKLAIDFPPGPAAVLVGKLRQLAEIRLACGLEVQPPGVLRAGKVRKIR